MSKNIKPLEYCIKSRDGVGIFGYYNKNNIKRNKIVIIFPGLTAPTYHYAYLRTRDILFEKGYDVFIISSYGNQKKNDCCPRSILEISMQRHVEDFNDVISFFSKFYDEVYAVGHSIGGRVLIISDNEKLKAQALLDPSGDFCSHAYQKICNCKKQVKEKDIKYIDWGNGVPFLVGNVMDELINHPFSDIVFRVENMKTPSLFVAAGAEGYAQVYEQYINSLCKYIEIPNTYHDFEEYGSIEAFVNYMLEFFEGI